MIEASLLKPDELDAIDGEVKRTVAQTLAQAKAAPMPTEADLLTDVYNRY